MKTQCKGSKHQMTIKFNSQWTENISKKYQYKQTKKGQIPKNALKNCKFQKNLSQPLPQLD